MTQPFIDFISQSPSAYHAAENVATSLEAAGFTRRALLDDDATRPGGHLIISDGAIIAWWVPENHTPRVRVVGSHTDSPGLMAKPDPDVVREGFRQVAVEVYGGPILAPVSYTHLTLPTMSLVCRSGWSPYH